MWAKMNDADLVAASDLIVMGEWVGQASVTLPGAPQVRALGSISVSEVLKGDARQTLALIIVPLPDGPVASDRIVYPRGAKGMWLLRRADATGLFLADHPQRFVPVGSADVDRLRKLIPPRPLR